MSRPADQDNTRSPRSDPMPDAHAAAGQGSSSAFVATRPGPDAETMLVESLASGHHSLARPVERGPTEPFGSLSAQGDDASSNPRLPAPGTRINQYEIIRMIGSGGMGAVFLARDTKLARRVAIKFLLTERTERNQRFVAEARTTARCHHANIVVIHDIDTYQDAPFMVLEYLSGQSMRQFLARKPVTPQRAIELILPVVRALERAHQHDIVHRDLKPENVFVTDDGVVKVLDFGIAKLLSEHAGEIATDGPARPDSLRFTRTGALVGTPPYMSPEQLSAGDVDHRTDLWAVGIMLYEMLLGEHPMAPLDSGKLLALADGDIAVPSARDHLRDIGELAAIIDRCLRSDREHRMGTARELLAALEACQATRHSLALTDDHSPFAGLAAFQERDAERFYGRSHEIAAILTRLRSQPLLTVVGPSGTGKSSLIRAGVIPALKQSGEGWHAMVLRPGRQPLEALADALTQLTATSPDSSRETGPDRSELMERLQAEPGALGAELRLWAGRTLRRVVLFVDQLEELYTLTTDPEQRGAFMRCLEGAADDAASPLRVITTIRSDFLDRAIHRRGMTAEVTRGLMFLAPMDREHLSQTLTGPVEAIGYRFESPELVEDMLDTLEQTPGALPLLQFAATRLWDARDREQRLITRDSYDAMGGVAGTLASHADAVLTTMSSSRLELIRAIFQRLVTPERTRAIATVGELRELPGDGDEIEQIVHHLADARLVAIEDSEDASSQVELIHESLITSWPTLGRWLDDSQDDAEFLARLRTAANEWYKSGEATGMLWRGETADHARRWHDRYPGELPTRERRYLEAVAALASRARRRTRNLLIGTIVVLAGLVVAAIVVIAQISDANLVANEQARAARAAEKTAREAETEIKRQFALAEAARAEKEAAEERDRLAQEKARAAQDSVDRAEAAIQESKTELKNALIQARKDRDRAQAQEHKAREAQKQAEQVKAEIQKMLDEKQQQVEEKERRIQKLERRRGKIAGGELQRLL